MGPPPGGREMREKEGGTERGLLKTRTYPKITRALSLSGEREEKKYERE